jgi:uncharacterized protein
MSCTPYEWEGVVASGPAAWAESNAICYGNSYSGLLTNRESGLSALACALTGYTPKYGLFEAAARRPNIRVTVTAVLRDPTDFSILGDWIGSQRRPEWRLPYGPIPYIEGLPADLSHEQRKALSAAAANYGSPLLYIAGQGETPDLTAVLGNLTFTAETLAGRYADLAPRQPISLIALGCPQASMGELRAAAELMQGRRFTAVPDDGRDLIPLWIFTSSANKAIAEKTGLADLIRNSGALLLENSCPEVVPYDPAWVKHILTNSMKAEHYLKSGLNGLPASVMTLADCIAIAAGEKAVEVGEAPSSTIDDRRRTTTHRPSSIVYRPSSIVPRPSSFSGSGLPSQGDFTVTAEAFVTDAPITFLGFVNRETGVIEEEGHPANGQSLAGKIAIFPKGSGSTVAPYVLLELFYRGQAPAAIVNTDIDQQTAPACSLEGIPYAYGVDAAVLSQIPNGATVTLTRRGDGVTLQMAG